MRVTTSRTFKAAALAALLCAPLACSSPPPATRAMPVPPAGRNMLKVCAPKQQLSRKDLETLAAAYGLYRGEKPSISEILKANEKCGKSEQAETLDLSKCERDGGCKTGYVLIPIH